MPGGDLVKAAGDVVYNPVKKVSPEIVSEMVAKTISCSEKSETFDVYVNELKPTLTPQLDGSNGGNDFFPPVAVHNGTKFDGNQGTGLQDQFESLGDDRTDEKNELIPNESGDENVNVHFKFEDTEQHGMETRCVEGWIIFTL